MSDFNITPYFNEWLRKEGIQRSILTKHLHLHYAELRRKTADCRKFTLDEFLIFGKLSKFHDPEYLLKVVMKKINENDSKGKIKISNYLDLTRKLEKDPIQEFKKMLEETKLDSN